MRLKAKDIKPLRELMLKQQKFMCMLCKKKLSYKDAALDHCHETGHIRGVLHKTCNSIEGRILHWAKRSRGKPNEFLQSLIEYWAVDYTTNPIHPTHRNDAEKEILSLSRRARKVKTPAAKQRYRDKIAAIRKSLRDLQANT